LCQVDGALHGNPFMPDAWKLSDLKNKPTKKVIPYEKLIVLRVINQSP
jgi:hypothetical protein